MNKNWQLAPSPLSKRLIVDKYIQIGVLEKPDMGRQIRLSMPGVLMDLSADGTQQLIAGLQDALALTSGGLGFHGGLGAVAAEEEAVAVAILSAPLKRRGYHPIWNILELVDSKTRNAALEEAADAIKALDDHRRSK